MPTPQQYLEKAASYIGWYGDYNRFNQWYWCTLHGYTYDPGWAWCAVFQSYVADDVGLNCSYSASSAAFGTQFPQISREDAQPGDIVLFNWDGRSDLGWTDHVGVVEWSDIPNSGYFGTIEGNVDSGEVKRCTRSVYNGYFTAFFRPSWDGSPKEDQPRYRVSIDPEGKEWLDEMIGLRDTGGSKEDFGGEMLEPIRWIAIEGVGKYRVYTDDGGFLPWVDGYNINDLDKGCAGDGSPISEIEIMCLIDPNVSADDLKMETHYSGWYKTQKSSQQLEATEGKLILDAIRLYR